MERASKSTTRTVFLYFSFLFPGVRFSRLPTRFVPRQVPRSGKESLRRSRPENGHAAAVSCRVVLHRGLSVVSTFLKRIRKFDYVGDVVYRRGCVMAVAAGLSSYLFRRVMTFRLRRSCVLLKVPVGVNGTR